jgi:hypothetical protein
LSSRELLGKLGLRKISTSFLVVAGVTTAVAAVLAAQDVTVPAEAATGCVITELAGELDWVSARDGRAGRPAGLGVSAAAQ